MFILMPLIQFPFLKEYDSVERNVYQLNKEIKKKKKIKCRKSVDFPC